MSERKRPVFGIMSLVLMLGLAAAAIFITLNDPAPVPITDGESLGVVIATAANIIATILIISAVSLTAAILAGISFLRRERPWPAAIGLCLAIPALVVVIIAITRL